MKLQATASKKGHSTVQLPAGATDGNLQVLFIT